MRSACLRGRRGSVLWLGAIALTLSAAPPLARPPAAPGAAAAHRSDPALCQDYYILFQSETPLSDRAALCRAVGATTFSFRERQRRRPEAGRALFDNLVRVRTSAPRDARTFCSVLSRLSGVRHVEPVPRGGDPDGLPESEPSFPLQWWLYNTGQTGGSAGIDINIAPVWNGFTTGDASVVVAVLDTGARITHQDLAASLWTNPGEIAGNGQDDDQNGYIDDIHGWNFAVSTQGGNGDLTDTANHGTGVASVIGAPANGVGIAGVAPDVRLMIVRWTEAEAVQYAIQMDADVINMSFGEEYSLVTEMAVAAARDAGIVCVASTGNENRRNYRRFPANYKGVIAVSASDDSDRRAFFANYGEDVTTITAPGSAPNVNLGILGAVATGDGAYNRSLGTTRAAAMVSGAAALLISHVKARYPDTPDGRRARRARVETLVSSCGTKIAYANPGQESLLGSGRLNAHLAFQADSDATPPSTSVTNLSASSVSMGRIKLLGTNATDNLHVAGYDVSMSMDGSTFTLLDRRFPHHLPFEVGSLRYLAAPGTTFHFRVRPYDVAGNRGSWSNVASAPTLTTNAAPLQPGGGMANFEPRRAIGTSGWTISPNIPVPFSGYGYDPDDDGLTYFYDWGDGTTTQDPPPSNPPIEIVSGSNSRVWHAWSAPGTYSVRLKVRDAAGAESPWSAPRSITVESIPNSPPSKPTLTGPSSLLPEARGTYTAVATDADGDLLTYLFDFDITNPEIDLANLTWIGPASSGSPMSAQSPPLAVDRIHEYRVRAIDSLGALSEWSDPILVAMINDPPSAPSAPSGPLTLYVNQPGGFTTFSIDPDGHPVTYTYAWGDGTSTTAGPFPSGQTAVASHAWSVLGTFSVSVFARDPYGAYSQFSGSRTVQIVSPPGGKGGKDPEDGTR